MLDRKPIYARAPDARREGGMMATRRKLDRRPAASRASSTTSTR